MSTATSFTAGTPTRAAAPTSSRTDITIHTDEHGHILHRRHTDQGGGTDEQQDGYDDPRR
jgi:hypothetical protein